MLYTEWSFCCCIFQVSDNKKYFGFIFIGGVSLYVAYLGQHSIGLMLQ